MNVLFLSPFFPPNAHHYCTALQERGVSVLGIGDEPPSQHAAHLTSLTEYAFEPGMNDYSLLRRAVASLSERHGPIDRLDSNGEHWLEAEGRLRDDFAVPGLGADRTRELRSKLYMGQVFREAGIAYPPSVPSQPLHRVRAFKERYGLPLVFKPDSGSGAVDTFVTANDDEFERALERQLVNHVIQPFVRGDIVTFDGLTDRNGQIVFCTSHAYDTGIMQVREGRLDGHYHSMREIPAELERVGRRAVAAFALRERFFHLEFFALPGDQYVALELNIRPPGGFTSDMMSAACDFNVYDLWARVLCGESFEGFSYERRYFTAHAGRRTVRNYRLSATELESELGNVLFSVQAVPDAFAATMGNIAYLLRSPDLATLKRAVALVQAPA